MFISGYSSCSGKIRLALKARTEVENVNGTIMHAGHVSSQATTNKARALLSVYKATSAKLNPYHSGLLGTHPPVLTSYLSNHLFSLSLA